MVLNTRMTAKAFFELPESNLPTELIDGELIVSPAPIPEHQNVSVELIILLRGLIPNGKLYHAPIDVYFDEANSVQPDIVWVAEGSQCFIGDKRLEGAPDLVIEILSPLTARRDKNKKFLLYEKHGVREYWLVDPLAQYIEVWRLEDGKFVPKGVFGPG
jgi:Uma2 family endonuclease